jgi:hypothetical protein
MKLLTKEILADFEKTGRQEDSENPKVVARFFNPTGIGTWYATEYDPTDRIFFGYVSLFNDHCNEWGSFSLDELESFRGKFSLGIERDLHFTPCPISQACEQDKTYYV